MSEDHADSVDARLAAVLTGKLSPYEGAFAAFRIVEGRRSWKRGYWARDDEGRLVTDDHDVWESDLRRPILAHLAHWWERREDLRVAVDEEIRAFVAAWLRGGEGAITADWAKWRSFVDRDGSPFADSGTNEFPEPRVVLEGEVDLRVDADPDALRLDLRYARLRSLEGIECFRSLRTLMLFYVKGLASVRELERVPGLRNLRISTEDPVLARAATELDFSRFPELQQLRLSCSIDHSLAIDTTWIPRARWLRELDVGAFTPAGGSYADIARAERLVRLCVTKLPRSDAEQLRDVLPLTLIELPDPIEVRNPGGAYPFELIDEYDDEQPCFSMSPELADRWGVYNESEAEDHLEALVEEHDPALLDRVLFDAEPDFTAISADSRYDLERVLKIAYDARSVRLERHLWKAIQNIQYDFSRRIGTYDMWERRDVEHITVRLEVLEREPDRLVAIVTVNGGEAVNVVGHPESDPDGADMCRAWLGEIAAPEESPAASRNLADEQLKAFRKLAIRVVRAIRRYHSDSPPILVDGSDPWDADAGRGFHA